MFSLYDRSVHARLRRGGREVPLVLGPGRRPRVHGHDFAKQSLRDTPWMHRRIDVDYNGWWMCLIPTQVIREIGLSLPMFIKWDDAEFGLRAGARGLPDGDPPGCRGLARAVDTRRTTRSTGRPTSTSATGSSSGLLHSPYPHGGRLVRESLENHIKRLMSMQYGTGETILLALQDVLDGPDRMHRDILHRLSEVRALRDEYDDGKSEAELDAFPSPRRKKLEKRGKGIPVPSTHGRQGQDGRDGLDPPGDADP